MDTLHLVLNAVTVMGAVFAVQPRRLAGLWRTFEDLHLLSLEDSVEVLAVLAIAVA